jgi:4-hydroxythreonine-4-phosphate dehydrogenase
MKILDDHLPIVAITMGDAAGVGPEVIAGALANQEVQNLCRPVVIGDVERLRKAAQILGSKITFKSITQVSDCSFMAMAIDVIDPQLIPKDLAWGALSAEAGHAAFEYVRIASELALAGSVQAICTAPLNKEALRLGGHDFPGHTELLSHLCDIPEVSMMLSTAKLNVIHVTTHIGLIDAVNKIEPGLVARTIIRGHEALVRSGIDHPRIGVCAINPHAGENGMFGYGEEEEKIDPAIAKVRELGIDAVGPLPADSLFFRAGRGDFDLVVAMYHDQGHAPIKLLGMEAGVNVTVGLPVIRTSVDHGTAFDIAGSGKADESSMIEALRLAAAMASRS